MRYDANSLARARLCNQNVSRVYLNPRLPPIGARKDFVGLFIPARPCDRRGLEDSPFTIIEDPTFFAVRTGTTKVTFHNIGNTNLGPIGR